MSFVENFLLQSKMIESRLSSDQRKTRLMKQDKVIKGMQHGKDTSQKKPAFKL